MLKKKSETAAPSDGNESVKFKGFRNKSMIMKNSAVFQAYFI
jgi:hypothetical protein